MRQNSGLLVLPAARAAGSQSKISSIQNGLYTQAFVAAGYGAVCRIEQRNKDKLRS
jgi:hypothetical protein